jgi:hypothetical protein
LAAGRGSREPGDKPSISGAHRLYEQHMQTNSKAMSRVPFGVIAREVLNQPQHQELANFAFHYPPNDNKVR